jgi:hypothetical protein
MSGWNKANERCCGGGNCGGTSAVLTTHSIAFAPRPATDLEFTSATIELGSGSPTPVTAGTVISVDP